MAMKNEKHYPTFLLLFCYILTRYFMGHYLYAAPVNNVFIQEKT